MHDVEEALGDGHTEQDRSFGVRDVGDRARRALERGRTRPRYSSSMVAIPPRAAHFDPDAVVASATWRFASTSILRRGMPHVHSHGVTEEEVEEVLRQPGEDRA